MSTIVIDPGHGGTSNIANSDWNHARGPHGLLEKAITLDIGLRVTERLREAGHQVVMTRDIDTNLGLGDRARVASSHNAAAFLSIHFNGNTDPNVQGTETWVHNASTEDSRLLAASVQQRIVAATGLRDRGVKKMGLGVLSLAYQLPATACCLVEISFLTNPTEETRLGTDAYKDQVAGALAQGLIDYVTHSTSVQPADPVAEGDQHGDHDG